MKEHWERERVDLRAELEEIRKQLHALETKQGGTPESQRTLSRWRVSKPLLLVVLPVLVLVAAGGALYGQDALNALFIDKDGKVGIGTTAPQGFQVVLPESTKPAAPNAGITLAGGMEGNASIELRNQGTGTPYIDFAQSSSVDYDARIRLTAPGLLTIEGANVGIGVDKPTGKLEVKGRIKDQTGYVMPVGSIIAYHGATAPDGWLLCDGSAIPAEAKYADLRALLPTSTTPDLRGRTLIGAGQGVELSLRSLGQQGGEENHKLTIDEMPAHHHHGFGEAYDPYWPFGRVGPKGQKGSRGGVDEDNFYYNTSDAGGNKLFNNMQPFSVVNYIIKY